MASHSSELRRQVEMAAALARQRLMDVHLRYAMELLEHARQHGIEPSRSLNIYTRLHKLTDEEARHLNHEVYVVLGKRELMNRVQATADSELLWERPRSILSVIRRRIRGRVNAELREWVEFHTGRAETALLWAHVENAHQFIELLTPGDSIAESVDVYANEVGLSGPRLEIVYFLSLDHRSSNSGRARPLPGQSGGLLSGDTNEQRRRSLRAVESRRVTGGKGNASA